MTGSVPCATLRRMVGGKLTRRRTLAGLGASVGAAPFIVGCRGKSGTPAGDATPREERAPRAEIVRRIASVSAIDGAGATVQRVFPSPQLRHLDPFVLLDDFAVTAPAGFPDHPHRGFEAFTYMIDGSFHHRDNLGNDSLITSGGTQRFNSGRGARHSEMPGGAGTHRGLQLWVNLPRRLKTMEPEYEGTPAERMPIERTNDLEIRTVVGTGSPVALHTEVDYLDVTLVADGGFLRTIPGERNTLVYVIAGSVDVAGQDVGRGQGVLLSPGELEIRGRSGARFAFLSGRPHGEPIRQRGPFVD
jgi:quercetin 2,3-dioxygenase